MTRQARRRVAVLLAGICLVALTQSRSMGQAGPGTPAPGPVLQAEAGSQKPEAGNPGSGIASQAGLLVLDVGSGRVVASQRGELVRISRVAPGALLKVATLISALDSGALGPSATFTCRRRVTAGDRQLVCVHPDLGRPLSPAEALAYSCNDFFATVGARLSRQALDNTVAALGLPPLSAGVGLPLAALGLDGMTATPEQLLRAFVRAVDPAAMRLRPDTRRVLLEGLRGAARYGTAAAIGERGVDALAQAATVPMVGGGYNGLAFAASPSSHPARAAVVLLPGGTAGDAAAIVADVLAQQSRETAGQPAEHRPLTARAEPVLPGSGPVSVPAGPPTTFDSSKRPEQDRAASQPRSPAALEDRNPDAEPSRPAGQSAQPGGDRPIRVGHQNADGDVEVVDVPLEEYVARVLAAESAPRSPQSALDALAIAVRTFALTNMGRHAKDGFDVCDQTHCQVMGTANAATKLAAARTAAQVLLYDGQLARVFYTACCGGQSELPRDVWGAAQDQPFLTRHKERPCRDVSEWTTEIEADNLLAALNAAGLEGDKLRNLRVVARSPSHRASVVRADGLTPGEITGDDLRLAVGRSLGWHLIKSTDFDVKRSATAYRFTGHGSGHGIGLCIVGSVRLANDGRSASKILQEYFPGTAIGPIP